MKFTNWDHYFVFNPNNTRLKIYENSVWILILKDIARAWQFCRFNGGCKVDSALHTVLFFLCDFF